MGFYKVGKLLHAQMRLALTATSHSPIWLLKLITVACFSNILSQRALTPYFFGHTFLSIQLNGQVSEALAKV